jgi:hypothetical protein
MGQWTLGDVLGAGAHERVFFASDHSTNMAAIKVVERNSRNYHSVDNEIETLRRVTDHAQKADDGDRIVRMAEVIYAHSEQFSLRRPLIILPSSYSR